MATRTPRATEDWLTTPAPFNTVKHGRYAVFSGDCKSVVTRWNPYLDHCNCLCYTSRPLSLGQVWQTTVLGTARRWRQGLGIGVTTKVQQKVPSTLPLGETGTDEFYFCGQSLYHNRKHYGPFNFPSLDNLSNGQSIGLQISERGQLNLFVDGKFVDTMASGLPIYTPFYGVVDVNGNCFKVKSETLCEDPKAILHRALQNGFIPHKDDLFLIHGLVGVGKSSLLSMILGKQRKLVRDSTVFAEEPLHMCPVRDESDQTFTADWEIVENDHLSPLLASTGQHPISSKKPEHKKTEEKEDGQLKKQLATEDFFANSKSSLEVVPAKKPSKKSAFQQLAPLIQLGLTKVLKKLPRTADASVQSAATALPSVPSLLTSLENVPDNMAGYFEKFQEDLELLMSQAEDVDDFIQSHSIRILDSGGQPPFLEIAPILLPQITGAIVVFELSELLSACGEVAWYKDGVQINVPCNSYFTTEQVIRHDLLAIQSETSPNSIEERPNLAFVGTFQDQQQMCTEETPDEKDEQLHSMITEILPEDMQQCIITNGRSLRHTTFRVNARTPEKQDFETVRQLKEALVTNSRAKSRNLPLEWCGFKVALHAMMEKMGRLVLSREECEFVGDKLGFDPPSLKAALNYLRELHIIWFHDALPHVVFGSSQVITDKTTEILALCSELKNKDVVLGDAEVKFVRAGIISLEMLAAFTKHYQGELFTLNYLMKLLISLLIASEVGPGEYLVPCVLEVSSIYPSPSLPEGSIRSSFALHFSKKSPMIGIYCCTISHLLNKPHWNLLTEGGEVVQVTRNSVTFEMLRGFPGKVSLNDPLSNYLEVVVELPAIVAEEHSASLYNEIRETLYWTFLQSMKMLHYKAVTPRLCFLCPEQSDQCSKKPHLATVDDFQTFLKCSMKPNTICTPMTQDQKMWLSAPK